MSDRAENRTATRFRRWLRREINDTLKMRAWLGGLFVMSAAGAVRMAQQMDWIKPDVASRHPLEGFIFNCVVGALAFVALWKGPGDGQT